MLKDADPSISPVAESPTFHKRLAGRDEVELHLHAPSSSSRFGDMDIEETFSCGQNMDAADARARSSMESVACIGGT